MPREGVKGGLVLCVNCQLPSEPMSSFSPGPTTSCTVFLSGLVKYPCHLSPLITRCVTSRRVGTASLQRAHWQRDVRATEWGIDVGLWFLDVFQPQSQRVDLYTDRLIRENIRYMVKVWCDRRYHGYTLVDSDWLSDWELNGLTSSSSTLCNDSGQVVHTHMCLVITSIIRYGQSLCSCEDHRYVWRVT